VKTIISKIKALFSKEVKQTEEIKPAGLNGADLLAWWNTIDPDSVISGIFSNSEGKGCVIGHYMRCTSKDPKDYLFSNMNDRKDESFRKWSKQALIKLHDIPYDIAEVNNGYLKFLYPQKTPWLRVEAFFKDVAKYEKENGPIVPIG